MFKVSRILEKRCVIFLCESYQGPNFIDADGLSQGYSKGGPRSESGQ